MIARLARLERASLFLVQTGEYLIGYCLGNREFVKAGMFRLWSAHLGPRSHICRLELIDSQIDAIKTPDD